MRCAINILWDWYAIGCPIGELFWQPMLHHKHQRQSSSSPRLWR